MAFRKLVFRYCLYFVFQANGLAAVGQYKGDIKSAAAGQSLFVAKHAY